MSDVRKPPKRRGSMNHFVSWLTRPETIKVAFAIVRLIDLVAKVIDKM